MERAMGVSPWAINKIGFSKLVITQGMSIRFGAFSARRRSSGMACRWSAISAPLAKDRKKTHRQSPIKGSIPNVLTQVNSATKLGLPSLFGPLFGPNQNLASTKLTGHIKYSVTRLRRTPSHPPAADFPCLMLFSPLTSCP